MLITGPTGVGKSCLGCALAQKACRDGYSALYTRVPKLLGELALARADGTYAKRFNELNKIQLLVLDDFGLTVLSDTQRWELLEVIEDRYHRRSTLITSQLPVAEWYQAIGDPTLADAILDRVVHNAYRITLQGESLRKTNDAPAQPPSGETALNRPGQQVEPGGYRKGSHEGRVDGSRFDLRVDLAGAKEGLTGSDHNSAHNSAQNRCSRLLKPRPGVAKYLVLLYLATNGSQQVNTMPKSVRVSDELYQALERESQVMHRSLSAQLEYLARLGLAVERSPHISARDLHALLSNVADEQPAGQETLEELFSRLSQLDGNPVLMRELRARGDKLETAEQASHRKPRRHTKAG